MPGESWSIVAAFALIAYLAGSIPFGLLLTKARGHGDIRSVGSGNIGATNVLRTGDKPLALATLFCDILKGFLPVLIAQRFGPDAAAAAAVAAPLGHIFPVWLRFKGGKGVATAGGALLAYAWPAALAAVATWIVVAIVFRYSSLAALAAAASAPLYAWLLLHQPGPTLVVLFIALVVIVRHRDNLARLLRGKESKIVLRKRRA
ncbi:MAG TPA: glycerol-3-phosphate 1-O-acyltransferase PlsY [Stellaceae bacterium]|jgi:glycerol-3-phosphate acyltransferase PlsY|nr:glycerol-3-phosphate 1-O-acyltransferase PlsY [Stellaceae bacterium]